MTHDDSLVSNSSINAIVGVCVVWVSPYTCQPARWLWSFPTLMQKPCLIKAQHRSLVTECSFFSFSSRGCVLPLTDAEQQLSEITEVCYEGKTKKVQLSWTARLRASCDQTVFPVYKGVKTFDLCRKHSLLVTGGMDRLVRMWNPHFSGWGARNLMVVLEKN